MKGIIGLIIPVVFCCESDSIDCDRYSCRQGHKVLLVHAYTCSRSVLDFFVLYLCNRISNRIFGSVSRDLHD